MADQIRLRTMCTYGYFTVIAKFHDVYFDKDSQTITFFREHGVLPISFKCFWCHLQLLFMKEKHLWYCSHSVPVPKKKKMCDYKVSNY